MISAYHIAKHAETVLEVLQALTKLLGTAGKPADTAIAMARAVLAVLTEPGKPSDPADISRMVVELRAELAKHDAKADDDLAKKFDVSDDEKAANTAKLKPIGMTDLVRALDADRDPPSKPPGVPPGVPSSSK